MQKNEFISTSRILDEYERLVLDTPKIRSSVEIKWAELRKKLKGEPANIGLAIDLCCATMPLVSSNEAWENEFFLLKEKIESNAFAPIWTNEWNWVKLFSESFKGILPKAEKVPVLRQRQANAKRGGICYGIDVRALEIQSSRQRGIGRYLTNLLRSMIEQASDARFVFYGNEFEWQIGNLDGLLDFANTNYRNYHPSFHEEFDVFLLTDPLPLLTNAELLPFTLNGKPTASIIYDLIPLAFAREYLLDSPKLHKQYIEKIYELQEICTAYLPISQFVGQDIHNRIAITKDRIYPIMGGLDPVFESRPDQFEITQVIDKFKLYEKYFIYAGGLDFRKNLKRALEAFAKLVQTTNEKITFVLVGEANEKLRKSFSQNETIAPILNKVITLGYVTDEELKCIYAASVGLIFPSLYEGFGLPALEAMASGCPVIASDGSSLKEICGDTALFVNPLSVVDIAEKMKMLMEKGELRSDLIARGCENTLKFTWKSVADKTLKVLHSLVEPKLKKKTPKRRMRVLLQNRENVFLERGGDTVVMEELYRGLANLDVEVDVHSGSPDLAKYDLVHLVNATLPELSERVTNNATSQGKPYTITTLFEDWPRYLNKSFEMIGLFKKYIQSGQNQNVFDSELEKLKLTTDKVIPSKHQILKNASALFACGESEKSTILEYYPRLETEIHIAKFGIRTSKIDKEYAKKIINSKLGFDEFILCCGRLETRKNQLMLLKAMEDSELPVVFATGGFSYQKPYVELVQQFQRKGKNCFLGKVDALYRDCAMAAASVHVLPSWYELPGLVTLEAAAQNTPVVASSWGAICDYMNANQIELCEPDDPKSIRAAIERALNGKKTEYTQQNALSYTWQNYAEQMYSAFENILSKQHTTSKSFVAISKEIQTKNNLIEENMKTSPSVKSKYDVSIVIPVFNRSDLTHQCIQALSECTDQTNYELIIVDNHSTDNTQQILQAIEGDVKIIREPQNCGFAVACNHGARVADGTYLVFLNNDTIPATGWLDEMVRTAQRNENIGAVGAKLIYPNGKIQHAGVAVSNKRIPYHIFQNFSSAHPAVNETREMNVVTAACMLVPKQIFLELGGFDEEYKNSFEDVDFCLRLRESGRTIVYNPKVSMIHFEQSTTGRTANDGANLTKFLDKWSSKLKQDDQEILARFNFEIIWGENGGKYVDLEKQTENPDNSTLDAAREMYSAGKLEEASIVLQNYVKSNMTLAGDENFEAWQTLGNCYARLNQAEQAEEAYLQAMKLNTDSERPYLGLASVALLKENWLAAQYGFMSALAKNPNSVKGKYGIGLTLAARSQYAQAMEQFKIILNDDPFNQEVLFSFYKAAMESGMPQSAVEPLIDYLEKYPQDTNFLFNLTGAFWKSGQLTEAAEICSRILEIDPQHESAQQVMRHLQESLALNV